MENDVRKGSGKMKCKKLYLLALCALLGYLFGSIYLITEKTSALSLNPETYSIVTERTNGSIVVGGNTFNLSNGSTEVQQITVPANSTSQLVMTRANLNNYINFDNNQPYFWLEYQINVWLPDNTTSSTTTCPQGDYNESFSVIDCETTIISQTDGAVMYRVRLFGKGAGNKNYIPLLQRFITFSNTSTSQKTIKWQYMAIKSTSYRLNTTNNQQLNDISNEISAQNTTYTQESNDYTTNETTTNNNINQGQTDINTGGSTLIGILQNFKTNVLDNINTSSNDCGLNLGSPYGFNMGTIDLCYYSPPNWLQNILNIVMSLALVGLAIHVFWRIINVIKGFAK